MRQGNPRKLPATRFRTVDPEIELVNDNTPEISRIQIELLVNSLATDMASVATLQYMRSVGQARMNWLGIEEGHHSLSHEPDDDGDAQRKLEKINIWFSGEVAFLAKRLAETPEPGVSGQSLLDNTTIVWTNELGKGNSHSSSTFRWCSSVAVVDSRPGLPPIWTARPQRLWLAIADAMGHRLETFGTEDLV